MTRALLTALLLGQTTTIVDPGVASRRANVDTCTGGKNCLDVKVVEGGGSSSGPSSVYILDAGPPINVNPPPSLPLPAGASTAAKQDTEAASLGSIDGKTPALVSGRVPVDGSGVVQPISGPVGVHVLDAGAPLNVNFPPTQATSMADGGVPASEASAGIAATELVLIRRLLEQLVMQSEQQTLSLQTLKDPGR